MYKRYISLERYSSYITIIRYFYGLQKAYRIVIITRHRDSISIWNLGRLTIHTRRQSHLLYLSSEIVSPWRRGHVATRIADKLPIIPISRFEEASIWRFLAVNGARTHTRTVQRPDGIIRAWLCYAGEKRCLAITPNLGNLHIL